MIYRRLFDDSLWEKLLMTLIFYGCLKMWKGSCFRNNVCDIYHCLRLTHLVFISRERAVNVVNSFCCCCCWWWWWWWWCCDHQHRSSDEQYVLNVKLTVWHCWHLVMEHRMYLPHSPLFRTWKTTTLDCWWELCLVSVVLLLSEVLYSIIVVPLLRNLIPVMFPSDASALMSVIWCCSFGTERHAACKKIHEHIHIPV